VHLVILDTVVASQLHRRTLTRSLATRLVGPHHLRDPRRTDQMGRDPRLGQLPPQRAGKLAVLHSRATP